MIHTLETVTYRCLQDVVVRASGRFPDTQFFLSKDPAMPYVLGRDLYRLLPRRGRHGREFPGRLVPHRRSRPDGQARIPVFPGAYEKPDRTFSPEELETRLYQLDGVRDVIVYEKNQQITAEVYADPAVFPDKAALWRSVSEINRHLPPYKQIGNLIYRENEFEKTATQKIRRRAATEAAS